MKLLPKMETNHPDITKIADAFGVHIGDPISSEVFAVAVDVYENVMKHEEENLSEEAQRDLMNAINIATGKQNPRN